MSQKKQKSADELAFLKASHVVSLFTDTSEKFWDGVVAQVDARVAYKEVQQRIQQPLALLCGKFTNNQENWRPYKKEASALWKVSRN